MNKLKVGHQEGRDEMRELSEKMSSQVGMSKDCQKYAAGGVAKIRLKQCSKPKKVKK